jgi:hypothetical protein
MRKCTKRRASRPSHEPDGFHSPTSVHGCGHILRRQARLDAQRNRTGGDCDDGEWVAIVDAMAPASELVTSPRFGFRTRNTTSGTVGGIRLVPWDGRRNGLATGDSHGLVTKSQRSGENVKPAQPSLLPYRHYPIGKTRRQPLIAATSRLLNACSRWYNFVFIFYS